MEVVYVAAAVLGLLSVGQSAPLTSCESLIKPLENPGIDKMVGMWMYIAEASEFPGAEELGKAFLESGWVNTTAGSQNNTLNVLQAQKVVGHCLMNKFNMTFENNIFHAVHPIHASGVLLTTSCPDCLLINQKVIMGGTTFSALQILSKRRSVTAAELEEFKKQVECLNLPSPFILDPQKGVCPDPQSASQGDEVIDMSHLGHVDPETIRLVDELVNTEGGIPTLLKMIRSDIAKLKEKKVSEMSQHAQ